MSDVGRVLDLMNESDDKLLELLGQQAQGLLKEGLSEFSFPEEDIKGFDFRVPENAKILGKRVWSRIERQMHDLLCGNNAHDEEDRKRILKAISNDDILAAACVYVLTAAFGLSPAIAALGAALLIRRVFKPAGQEFCAFWAEHLK